MNILDYDITRRKLFSTSTVREDQPPPCENRSKSCAETTMDFVTHVKGPLRKKMIRCRVGWWRYYRSRNYVETLLKPSETTGTWKKITNIFTMSRRRCSYVTVLLYISGASKKASTVLSPARWNNSMIIPLAYLLRKTFFTYKQQFTWISIYTF